VRENPQSSRRSLIVGTAGHIDHGKSALVRALTGQDPDRLPEEKRRGITIDLGFADLELGDLRFGFVDVPGHERFIKNMLAGAHGIDLLALVIAGDEGVMPQTREHFDICRLLGIRNGLIVLTKKDLVEEELLPLVEDEARDLVAGSFLEGAPVIAVSSRTGEGMSQLRAALTEVAQRVPARSADFITRLPIDRAFSMKGFGAVVTGTLISGEIAEGDEVELLPQRLAVRVRGVQVHGKPVARALAGQRTALNLAGVDVASVERGMVLAPLDRLHPTQIIDISVHVLPTAPRGLRSRARVRVHIGAAEVLGRIRILDDAAEISPGKSGLAQLRLEAPVVALHGDHFILRTYSPPATIAGGTVVDPQAVKHRGKEMEQTRARLRALLSIERAMKVATFVQISGDQGLRFADLVAMTGWTDGVLEAAASQAEGEGTISFAEGLFLATVNFEHLCQSLLQELMSHHKSEPLARGQLRETLREKIFPHSDVEVFRAVIARLEKEGAIVSEKDTIRAKDHKIDVSAKDAQLRDLFQQVYEEARLEAPSVEEAMARASVPASGRVHARKILQLLIDGQSIVRVQGETFMSVKALEELKAKLQLYGSQHEPERLIDVAAFKELAGISRKYAIPLLEYFDREHVTRRAGDRRVILKGVS